VLLICAYELCLSLINSQNLTYLINFQLLKLNNQLLYLGYITITAHFIDRCWNYQKRIISFTPIPNHKGLTIGKKVEEVLKEWGTRNVSTITVDNASSNDVVVGYLKKRLKIKNGLLGEGDHFHMRCVAHILNLVVMDGLKDQDMPIVSICNAVRFVRSSPQRALKFKECIEM